MSDKFLIVGLGNPGREYRYNRHNIGFMLLDRLVEKYELPGFTRRQGKALFTTGEIGGAPIILAKPQTYMNLSGEAVSHLVRFYEIRPRDQLLVCLDDVDLPLGTLRVRAGGSSGGQRGLQSIIDHLVTPVFPRLRIGIGRPAGQRGVSSHVLRDLRNDEIEIIHVTLNKAVDAIECFIRSGVVLAMSRYNSRYLPDKENDTSALPPDSDTEP